MSYFTSPKGELFLTNEDIFSRINLETPQKLKGLLSKPKLLKHPSDLKIISQMYRIRERKRK